MDEDVKESRRRFKEAKEAISHIHDQMREDFAFSDPSNPQQWHQAARTARERDSRPCMTFDQTNQYILQVVNDARQNKPSIKVRGVSGDADVKAADALQGLIMHIEDASRAAIAYDTAIEHAARVGLGFIRITTEITNPALNQKEIRIKRVHNPFSVVLDPGWTEPDGSDAMYGYIEHMMSREEFERQYPKADVAEAVAGDDWCTRDMVRVVDEFNIEEDEVETYIVIGPNGRMELSDVDYDALSQQMGGPVPYVGKYKKKNKVQTWRIMSGVEIIEESEFPASFVPLVPVIGNESWTENGNKRWLCGMVRRMMDPARAYNYERSAYIETVALQPKAPFIMSKEAAEGFEDMWANANSSNLAALYFNENDDDGKPITGRPQRQNPPTVATAFAQGAIMARDDLQASIGMYRSNLGAPSNAVSGRAKMQDQREGDTATFHYIDNGNRSISHVGRIALQMIPKIYDTKRAQRILGEDGASSQIIIDPSSEVAARVQQQPPRQGQQSPPKPQVILNPTIGEYDVSVSTGPSYSTRRQETADALAQLIQGNPQMFGLVGDVLAKMQDWPEADKIAARLHAMLPPQVLAAESADDPQQAQAQQAAQHIQQLTQQLQQAQQMMQQMDAKIKEKANNEAQSNANDHDKNKIAAYQAETARLGVLVPADPQLAAALYQQTLQAVMGLPTPMGGLPSALPPGVPPPQIPPPPPPPQQTQGPSGPSSFPQ
jgi:hypothetical protein